MPVRAIKRLETELLTLYVPQAIVESYIEWAVDNTFEILVQRHFDKNGRVLRTIGDQITCTWESERSFRRLPYFIMRHHPLIRKYGVLSNEYLECIYQNKVHERDVGPIFKKIVQERNAIFPEREVEESDIPSE